MKIKQKDKELISKEIENLEKYSSAELVAVVTKRSSDYKYAISLINIFVLFSISFLLIFFTQKEASELLQIQLLIFVGISLFFEKFNNFVVKLLPKTYKYNKASKNAHKQFYNLGLNRTKTRQGIMFFVSYDEKYVEIIADKEISKKIDDEYWQVIVKEFIKDVKNNNLSNGYVKAIKSCSEILVKNFPIQTDDENELSNEIIELKP